MKPSKDTLSRTTDLREAIDRVRAELIADDASDDRPSVVVNVGAASEREPKKPESMWPATANRLRRYITVGVALVLSAYGAIRAVLDLG